jgi:hypothetical protein
MFSVNLSMLLSRSCPCLSRLLSMLVQVVHVFYTGVIRDNRKTGIEQGVVNGFYMSSREKAW